VLERIIAVYILWQEYLHLFPKTSRYTLGGRIDTLFVETIESISTATFLTKTEKQPWVRRAIGKIDTIKVLLRVAWEIRALDEKKYVALSLPLDEIGRMLGGWHNQLAKQNSPESGHTRTGEK
jgi:hypothetical protein